MRILSRRTTICYSITRDKYCVICTVKNIVFGILIYRRTIYFLVPCKECADVIIRAKPRRASERRNYKPSCYHSSGPRKPSSLQDRIVKSRGYDE